MKNFFISNESSKSHETLIFVQTLQKKKPKVNANVKDRIENLFLWHLLLYSGISVFLYTCKCISERVFIYVFKPRVYCDIWVGVYNNLVC